MITGRRKNLHWRKHVFTNALGDRKMYEFIHDNPSMESYPVSYTNNPQVIAANDNMISITPPWRWTCWGSAIRVLGRLRIQRHRRSAGLCAGSL